MLPIDQLDPSVFLTAHGWIQLLTLTVLEIVLGIDNIIVISILSGELPKHQQRSARRTGLALAMITRILLLLTLSALTRLTQPLFTWGPIVFDGRSLVLILGGIYLLYKSGAEIRGTVELHDQRSEKKRRTAVFWMIVTQIVLIDIVFSLDSVITAVGMSNEILIMMLAVIIAVLIMLLASDGISAFVNKHASVKILALAFLFIVGVVLVLDGAAPGFSHRYGIKNYAYGAMAFSVAVELLNLRMRRNQRRLDEEN
ncbi:MAG TPA: TerC family protein [Flavobacteriales bacterium]|jgi:predicted tellurium resistance membrane protein TerC|nr:TerC family protein [Flavobacteriales bacterium]